MDWTSFLLQGDIMLSVGEQNALFIGDMVTGG